MPIFLDKFLAEASGLLTSMMPWSMSDLSWITICPKIETLLVLSNLKLCCYKYNRNRPSSMTIF